MGSILSCPMPMRAMRGIATCCACRRRSSCESMTRWDCIRRWAPCPSCSSAGGWRSFRESGIPTRIGRTSRAWPTGTRPGSTLGPTVRGRTSAGSTIWGGWAARSTGVPRRRTRRRRRSSSGSSLPHWRCAGHAPPRRRSTASTNWPSPRPSTRRTSGTVAAQRATWMRLSGAAWSMRTPWRTCWTSRPAVRALTLAYPSSRLAGQLRLVGRLIKADFGGARLLRRARRWRPEL